MSTKTENKKKLTFIHGYPAKLLTMHMPEAFSDLVLLFAESIILDPIIVLFIRMSGLVMFICIIGITSG